MVFDVIVRDEIKNNGKMVFSVMRVHHFDLSKFVRKIQDDGKYVFAVIPLFRRNRRGDDENGSEQKH